MVRWWGKSYTEMHRESPERKDETALRIGVFFSLQLLICILKRVPQTGMVGVFPEFRV